jgi:hypothetical protein
MEKHEVLDLMMGSSSEQQWNDKCTKVKVAFDGKYPDFWFKEIIQSGVAGWVQNSWREVDKMRDQKSNS